MQDNSENNKKIVKNTSYLYFRMLLIMAVSLFTVRVILQVLGAEDYGVYSAVAGFVSTLAFITSVLTHASQRFLSIAIAQENIENTKKVFGTLFFAYFISAVFVFIFTETVGLWFVMNKLVIPLDRMSSALWVYQFSILSFVMTLLMNPFQALIIAKEEMNIYAFLSIFDVMLKLVIVYLLFISTYDKLKTYALLYFISGMLVNSVYLFFCRKKYKETHFSFKIERKIFKSIFSFSSWTLFGSVAGVINTQGVNILLNVFFGPIANAAFAISSQVSNALNSLGFNFFTALRPPIVKAYACNDYLRLYRLTFIGSKSIFALMAIFIVPLFAYMPVILDLWLGKVSEYMVVFSRLMLVYTFILSMGNPLTAIAQAVGCVKPYHGIVDGVSILSLPFIYLVFSFGGKPSYAFYIIISIFALNHILRLLIVGKYACFPIKNYLKEILLPVSLVLALLAISSILIVDILSGDLFIAFLGMFLIAIITIILSIFLVFNSNERVKLLKYLKNKRDYETN